MIVRIASGVHGFDNLTSSEEDVQMGLGLGGIPENTVTLIYGPENVGKSIFCYDFAYNGLKQDEPCLYLSTDQDIQEIYQNMLDIGLELDEYLENQTLYVIDAATEDPEFEISEIYQTASVRNPTDILIKLTRSLRLISDKSPRLRGIVDSATTILQSNSEMLIIRVLKTYILRIKEAGGTAVITYTQNTSDHRTETLLKSMVDNIIYLDGETITIEAMKGLSKKEATYQINEDGMVVLDNP
jgi:KaiC/GvpD/RAD55 family RecA-like ATPase